MGELFRVVSRSRSLRDAGRRYSHRKKGNSCFPMPCVTFGKIRRCDGPTSPPSLAQCGETWGDARRVWPKPGHLSVEGDAKFGRHLARHAQGLVEVALDLAESRAELGGTRATLGRACPAACLPGLRSELGLVRPSWSDLLRSTWSCPAWPASAKFQPTFRPNPPKQVFVEPGPNSVGISDTIGPHSTGMEGGFPLNRPSSGRCGSGFDLGATTADFGATPQNLAHSSRKIRPEAQNLARTPELTSQGLGVDEQQAPLSPLFFGGDDCASPEPARPGPAPDLKIRCRRGEWL